MRALLVIGLVAIVAAVLLYSAMSFGQFGGGEKADKLKVVVSILPQSYVVGRIGGDKLEVQVLVPSGFAPETYEPTPKEIAYVSRADLYFRIGYIGFEKTRFENLVSINPLMKVVDTSASNRLRSIEAHSHEGEEGHSEEQELGHEEQEIDPHVWLVPSMVEQQAQIILNTLVGLDVENEQYYRDNFALFSNDLDELDNTLRKAFEPIRGKKMLVYHPAFGYLADEYGFEQEYFQIEGKDPTAAQLQSIIDLAKSEDIRVIFVQKQFSKESAEVIAEEINGVVVEIDPLAENYIENMKSIADVVSSSLK